MTRGAKRSVALAIVLVVGAAGALASSSRATWPGKNGRIAYMVQDRAGHWQIWVANSDLSGAKKLTHGRYDSGWAVWSPDGKRLAFDSDRTDHTPNDSEHVNDVFVMKSSGSAVKKLTDSKGVSGDAAWSPDGKLIAFDADRGNRKGFSAVYVLPANGGKPRKVTSPRPPLSDYKPRFSPDGKHLVFTREHGTADSGPAALFTVRLDGSDLRRLTPYSLHADDSDWSPDGKRIVFDGYPGSEAFGDIYVVGANGGSAVDLTRDTDGQADPVWSPDGRKILFLDNRHVNGVGRTGLATMNADGSARQFVSSQNVEAHQADWESIAGGAQPHASARPRTQSELTLFVGPENGVAQIVSVQGNQQPTIWHCPRNVFCGEPVSFAWAPDGRRVAFTLDEIGGTSAYVGFHVLDVVSGHDTRIPGGAPRTASTTDDPSGWAAYFKKMRNRIGCWPAANLAWSADGSRLAYDCIAAAHPGGAATRSRINVLTLRGSGHRTVPTGSNAFWPSWSPNATRLVYSTRRRPSKASEIYTVAIDGSHRRLVARGGAAPAWSPDGRTIAYQTPCGIRLVTPSGRDVTPRAITNACGSIDLSGPPAWSPDGTKLAVGTEVGLYEFDKGGSGLHLAGDFVVSPTWYGKLPARPSWRPVR